MIRTAAAALLLAVGAGSAPAAGAAPCRDRFLWPFSSTSVWNMPLGSGAVFEPARIFSLPFAEGCALRRGPAASRRVACLGGSPTPAACAAAGCCWDANAAPAPACYVAAGGPAQSFHNDQDLVVLATASDPTVDWVDQGDWSGGDKCAVTGKVAARIQLPDAFSTSCVLNNNALAVLSPDNRTLLQMQPAYRLPGAAQPLLARYHAGCPVPFPWAVDILGDAPWGAHGGSGLSSMGGVVRAGELAPGAPPLRHALKLELFAHDYYFSGGTAAPYADCFAWPALGCDSYAHDASSPQAYNGSNPRLKPGALLAIPPGVSVPVATEPARLLRDALATYGGYIVDDTASDDASVCMEPAAQAQLLADYGITVDISNPARPGVNANTTAFYEDLVRVFRALAVVANNANGTVGGGGTPLAPLAPPICGA